ncbi:DUF1902 domain-containing protein [Thiohalorhabdus sp.]|uniref:DUF1902 domain-containing protein n=1 Tax=Thiohalorhabdus sp. TaxID=3094134 RepID=UPI002FC27E28
MATKVFHVQTFWDPEAEVWVATSDDIIGLATEAEDMNRLRERLRSIIPELLRENGQIPAPHDGIEIPYELIARDTIQEVAHQ